MRKILGMKPKTPFRGGSPDKQSPHMKKYHPNAPSGVEYMDMHQEDNKPPEQSEHMRKHHPSAAPGIEFMDYHEDMPSLTKKLLLKKNK